MVLPSSHFPRATSMPLITCLFDGFLSSSNVSMATEREEGGAGATVMEADLAAVLVVADRFIYTLAQAGNRPVTAYPEARPRAGPAADGLSVRQGVGTGHDVVGVGRHDECFQTAHVRHVSCGPAGSPFPRFSIIPFMPPVPPHL